MFVYLFLFLLFICFVCFCLFVLFVFVYLFCFGGVGTLLQPWLPAYLRHQINMKAFNFILHVQKHVHDQTYTKRSQFKHFYQNHTQLHILCLYMKKCLLHFYLQYNDFWVTDWSKCSRGLSLLRTPCLIPPWRPKTGLIPDVCPCLTEAGSMPIIGSWVQGQASKSCASHVYEWVKGVFILII